MQKQVSLWEAEKAQIEKEEAKKKKEKEEAMWP